MAATVTFQDHDAMLESIPDIHHRLHLQDAGLAEWIASAGAADHSTGGVASVSAERWHLLASLDGHSSIGEAATDSPMETPPAPKLDGMVFPPNLELDYMPLPAAAFPEFSLGRAATTPMPRPGAPDLVGMPCPQLLLQQLVQFEPLPPPLFAGDWKSVPSWG